MSVTCPACQKPLQSKADLSGKKVKCGCGHAFVVPAASAAGTATAVAAPARPATVVDASVKIAVKCACGKSLQAPATAAGKAVKCPCGQVVKVPAPAAPVQRSATAKPVAAVAAAPAPAQRLASPISPVNTGPDPFANMSDDEWKSLVQSTQPKKVDDSKPKEKSAAAKMLDEARKETGKGNVLAMESALGFLNKTRGILVGLGILYLVRMCIEYWMNTSFIDSLAAQEEADVIAAMKMVVMVICGFGAGIGILFIIMGFLVSVLPMTCAICALLLFILMELFNFLFNPFTLISIRDWIFRIVIFGGLIQGINNAAYYRFLKAEERAAKKARAA